MMGMWRYHKGRYHSRADALEEEYRSLLESNTQLRQAVDNIRLNERAIDSIMEELDDADDE